MKKSLLLAAASLAVISCSKREFGTQEPIPTDNQVRFDAGTSGVAVKVGVDAAGHSTFEVGDIIGVYAVNHGKKLGVAPLVSTVGTADGVFPALQNLQFLNKKYLVKTVDAYVTTPTASPALAHFVPNEVGTDEIYYQTGDLGWNYYAYYPAEVAVSSSPFKSLPSTAAQATAANFLKTDATLAYMNQTSIAGTDIGTDAYPGPIMFAYESAEDKTAKPGVAKSATNLAFKYANAKITLDVELKGSVGVPNDIRSIIMCDDEAPLTASGLTAGLNFDLTKADAKGVASGVYDVIAPSTGGTALTGLPVNASTKLPVASGNGVTAAYHFGYKTIRAVSHNDSTDYVIPATITDPKLKREDKGKDSTLISTTGYLIPAGNTVGTPAGTLKNVVIKFYVGSGSSAEVFTAKLDETKGGTLTGTKPGTSPARDYKNFLPKIEPGKEYKFKIVLNKQGVSFTGTIEDWTVVDNTGTTIPAE